MTMVADVRERNKINNQKGQALIEFFLFLPIILVLFGVTLKITGAINGSINQNKAVRGYFYYLIKGNSKIPNPEELGAMSSGSTLVGMFAIGWMDYLDSMEPVSSCYKIDDLVTEANDTCDKTDSITSTDPVISKYIRAYSVYGICTPYLYSIDGADSYRDISGAQWQSQFCTRR